MGELIDNLFMIGIATLVWSLIAYLVFLALAWLFNKADAHNRPSTKASAKVTGKRIIPAHTKRVTDWDYEHDIPTDFEVEVHDKHILEIIIDGKPTEAGVTDVLYLRIEVGDTIPVYYSTGRISKKIVSVDPVWSELYVLYPNKKTPPPSPAA